MTLDEFIADNDSKPQNQRLSNVEIAERYGTSETSVRRHRRKLNHTTATDTFFKDLPNEVITSRGASIRTEDGSWQKVSWNPLKLAIMEAQTYDDLERAISSYSEEVFREPTSERIEIFGGADEQVGKALESGGGSAETVTRVMSSAHAFALRVQKTKPSTIVMTDLGDGIENMWNVPQHQLSTNDLSLMDQVRTFRRLQIEVLKILAPLAPNVIYVSVPSNHGQVRTGPKAAVGGVDNDFGIEVSFQLEDVCSNAESPALKNIQFVRPEKFMETAVLEVGGVKLAFNHGHRTSGGINGHDKWWANQDHGRMPGWDADILVVAHYHTFKVEQSGDGRWIICVSASEPSSDYFALAQGKRSKRGVTCFAIEGGAWTDLEIL